MSIEEALARRRGSNTQQGDIRAKLAARRAARQLQPVLSPEEEGMLRENLPEQRRLPMPTPATTGELIEEGITRAKETIPGYLSLAATMAPPIIAGTAASMAIPVFGAGALGAAATGAAGGVLGGVTTRAVSNLMTDRPVFEGNDLSTLGMDAGLGGVFGAGTGIVKNLLARRAAATPSAATARPTGGLVSDLPGYDQAISMNAPLPPAPKLKLKNLKSVEVDPASVKPTFMEGVRSVASSPEFVLSRSPNQWARMAGERLHGARSLARQLRQQGYYTLGQTGLTNLDDDGRKAVTVILSGRGDELPAQFKTPEVLDAAQRMRADFYDAAARKFTEAGVKTTSIAKGKNFGKNVDFKKLDNYSPAIPNPDTAPKKISIRQKLALRRRPKQALMQRRGSDYTPADQALDELNGVELETKPWRTDALEIADTYLDGGQGRTGFPELVARSRFFGAPVKKPTAGQPWGDASNKLYQRMLVDQRAGDAELFKVAMDDAFRPPLRTPGEQVANKIRDKVAHVLLGQTFSTQYPQVATPVSRYGFKNSIKGLRDYKRDPSFQTLSKVSGAEEAGIARELSQGTVPRKLMESVEGGLRGRFNAGFKYYLDDIIQDVQAGKLNAATMKKLQELHMQPSELQGGMTADLLKRGLNVSADRFQFHPYETGASGWLFTNPYGKLFSQFQPFGHSAWRLQLEDVLEPLLGPQGWKEAWRTGDYSLQGLGAARAARQLAAGIPASIATEATKSVMGLREPDPGNVIGSYLGSHFGTPGQFIDVASSGFDPTRSVTMSPLASMWSMHWNNIKSGHLERPIYDLLAARDPTGWMSFARPAVYSLTKER